MTPEPDSATDFYAQLVGWTTEPWEGADRPYTLWKNKEVPVGGLMNLPEEAVEAGAPPHWLAYISTPDIAATVSRATELGGKILVQPTEVPGAGRFAVLQDPQGAVFAAYTPGEAQSEPEGPPQIGQFSWHELATSDHGAAFVFYHDLFGWDETESMDMGEAGVYQMYGCGGSEASLGGMFNKPAEMPGPPAWLFYIKVADVNAAVDKVKELGGRVLNGPMEVPGGDLIAQCMDPQGAVFAVHSSNG
jgi:predicted enzyme related to lactoylglutathione lyase